MFLLLSSLMVKAQDQIAILYPSTVGNKEYPLLHQLHTDLQLTALSMVDRTHNVLDENYIFTQKMIKTCSVTSCSVEIGRELGADYVIETQFVDLSDNLTFILKVYNVHTGMLLSGFSEKNSDYNELSNQVIRSWEQIVTKEFGDGRDISYVTQDQVDYWKNLYKREYAKNMQRHVEYTQQMEYKPTKPSTKSSSSRPSPTKTPTLSRNGKIIGLGTVIVSLCIPVIAITTHRITHYKVNTLDSDGSPTTVWREKPNNKEETSDNTTQATYSQIPPHHIYGEEGKK